jgi:hypothetical protein
MLLAVLVAFSVASTALADVLVIVPQEVTLPPGGHVKFHVQLFNNQHMPQRVQEQVEWSVEPEWLGKISDDGFFIAGERPGKGEVIARLTILNRVYKATAKVKVGPGVVDMARGMELIIKPAQAALLPGEQLQFTARIVFAGNVQPMPPVLINWAVRPDSLGKITQSGLFEAGNVRGQGLVIAYVEFMGERLVGKAHIVVGMKAASAIAGTVLDEDLGGAIAGATVTAQRIGEIRWYRRVQTDQDGNYMLGDLLPGYYVIRAKAKGFIAEFYQDVRKFSEATPVQVAEKDTVRGIDFHLNHGGVITGTVVSEADSMPIARAHVFAVLKLNPKVKYHAVTNDSGKYAIEGLPTGSYLVGADAEGYTMEFYDDAHSLMEATLVQVQEGNETSGIDFALSVRSAISGRVISQKDSTAIPGAVVVARPLNMPNAVALFRTRTDSSGRYVLQVPPGNYIVRAEADSFNAEFYDDVYDPALATPVAVQENAHTSGIDFALAPMSVVRGTVTDEADQSPIANAWVWAFPEIPDREPVKTRTNSDGTYELNRLAPGIYFLKAAAKGYNPEFYEEAARLADATPVQIGYDQVLENVNFTLTKAASISGTVLADDGSPVVRAVVIAKMVDSHFARKALTDENGAYTIEGLKEGTYIVKAMAEGFYPEFYDNAQNREDATPVAVAASQQVTGIDFSLTPAPDNQGAITGIVRNEKDEAPIAGAFVMALPVGGGKPSFAVTNAEGRYKITGLATGKYFVAAWAEGYVGEFYDDARNWRRATPVAVVSPNVTHGIHFDLKPKHVGPYVIQGRILARNGQPLAYVLVFAVSKHGQVIGFGLSDENGYYTIAGMPAGHFKIFATAPGWMQNNDGDPSTQDSLAVDLSSGQDTYQADITMDVDFMTDVSEGVGALPSEFALHQNYPNPFNPETAIRFEIPVAGKVTLKIYNALGQEVITLVNASREPGKYAVTWNGRDRAGNRVPSGIYFYQLKVQDGSRVLFRQVRKMTLMK